MRARLTYFVSAYGSDMLVPSIAHVGVKRATPSGDMLNIWPLWYKTTTEDMHGFAYQPNYPDNTANRRGKTTHSFNLLKHYTRKYL